jgi:hypothetical protein
MTNTTLAVAASGRGSTTVSQRCLLKRSLNPMRSIMPRIWPCRTWGLWEVKRFRRHTPNNSWPKCHTMKRLLTRSKAQDMFNPMIMMNSSISRSSTWSTSICLPCRRPLSVVISIGHSSVGSFRACFNQRAYNSFGFIVIQFCQYNVARVAFD